MTFYLAGRDDFCFVSDGWRATVLAILYLGGYYRFQVMTNCFGLVSAILYLGGY